MLNFSPGTLEVPAGVKLKSVDLTVSLESLSFFLAQEVKMANRKRPRRTSLSHVDARGRLKMVDVGAKAVDRSRSDRARLDRASRARRCASSAAAA